MRSRRSIVQELRYLRSGRMRLRQRAGVCRDQVHLHQSFLRTRVLQRFERVRDVCESEFIAVWNGRGDLWPVLRITTVRSRAVRHLCEHLFSVFFRKTLL